MRLRFSSEAKIDLVNLANYISADSPNNAEIVGERLLAATKSLLERPHMSREGRRSGTREWAVLRTPYILIYSISGTELRIVRILHGRQSWPQ